MVALLVLQKGGLDDGSSSRSSSNGIGSRKRIHPGRCLLRQSICRTQKSEEDPRVHNHNFYTKYSIRSSTTASFLSHFQYNELFLVVLPGFWLTFNPHLVLVLPLGAVGSHHGCRSCFPLRRYGLGFRV